IPYQLVVRSALTLSIFVTITWHIFHILVFKYDVRPTFFLLIVIPIEYELARSIVPEAYPLLPVNTTILPNFPKGKHPLLVRTGCDFDIKNTAGLWKFGLAVLLVPFVDRLGDNQTSFMYIAASWQDEPLAILLASAFAGVKSNPSIIEPHPRDLHATFTEEDGNGNTLERFRARGVRDDSGVELDLTKTGAGSSPWSERAFTDILNFPSFGLYSGDLCLVHFQHLSKTHSFVHGNVAISAPTLFSDEKIFRNVFGTTASKSFYEGLNVNCQHFASWNFRAMENNKGYGWFTDDGS
ncbi:uncharacterized protein EI90DRAFT_3034039, partial [Cantharellus anzutake]|uniref:uncharacterized protein n=1 Tax=Cantharellus anzutake TaxID=1750568 RepID=UPI0019072676